MERIDPTTLYRHRWMAYFKNHLCSPTIVHGESEAAARNEALAHYRKQCTLIDMWPMDAVVARVEYIG